jgi:SpoVK/Ycf46/Vps4 family AAA+-type ATPase
MRFSGTASYIATDDLSIAVNAAVTLERPLLVKGEPGTGKTVLAVEVAKSLGLDLIEWHIKSTTKANQGLYEYDAVSRLRDGQMGEERAKDVKNYIKKGKLWEAFTADKRPVPDNVMVAGLCFFYAVQQSSNKAGTLGQFYFRQLNQTHWNRLNGNTRIRVKVVDGGSSSSGSPPTSSTNGLITDG